MRDWFRSLGLGERLGAGMMALGALLVASAARQVPERIHWREAIIGGLLVFVGLLVMRTVRYFRISKRVQCRRCGHRWRPIPTATATRNANMIAEVTCPKCQMRQVAKAVQ